MLSKKDSKKDEKSKRRRSLMAFQTYGSSNELQKILISFLPHSQQEQQQQSMSQSQGDKVGNTFEKLVGSDQTAETAKTEARFADTASTILGPMSSGGELFKSGSSDGNETYVRPRSQSLKKKPLEQDNELEKSREIVKHELDAFKLQRQRELDEELRAEREQFEKEMREEERRWRREINLAKEADAKKWAAFKLVEEAKIENERAAYREEWNKQKREREGIQKERNLKLDEDKKWRQESLELEAHMFEKKRLEDQEAWEDAKRARLAQEMARIEDIKRERELQARLELQELHRQLIREEIQWSKDLQNLKREIEQKLLEKHVDEGKGQQERDQVLKRIQDLEAELAREREASLAEIERLKNENDWLVDHMVRLEADEEEKWSIEIERVAREAERKLEYEKKDLEERCQLELDQMVKRVEKLEEELAQERNANKAEIERLKNEHIKVLEIERAKLKIEDTNLSELPDLDSSRKVIMTKGDADLSLSSATHVPSDFVINTHKTNRGVKNTRLGRPLEDKKPDQRFKEMQMYSQTVFQATETNKNTRRFSSCELRNSVDQSYFTPNSNACMISNVCIGPAADELFDLHQEFVNADFLTNLFSRKGYDFSFDFFRFILHELNKKGKKMQYVEILARIDNLISQFMGSNELRESVTLENFLRNTFFW